MLVPATVSAHASPFFWRGRCMVAPPRCTGVLNRHASFLPEDVSIFTFFVLAWTSESTGEKFNSLSSEQLCRSPHHSLLARHPRSRSPNKNPSAPHVDTPSVPGLGTFVCACRVFVRSPPPRALKHDHRLRCWGLQLQDAPGARRAHILHVRALPFFAGWRLCHPAHDTPHVHRSC